MKEHDQYQTALTAAEATYTLWELSVQQGILRVDLDHKMRRLKDLAAYALTRADIVARPEIVELFALGLFFGATSDPRVQQNQQRLHHLSNETIDYEGQAENIADEIAAREKWSRHRDTAHSDPFHPGLC